MKSKIYSFRLLTLCLLATGFSQITNAQDVYWREGFETGTTFGNSAAASLPARYATGSSSAGTWYEFLAYRTTGTGCVNGAPGTNGHIRFANATNVALDPLVDSGYLVTPTVDFGIGELHFTRSRIGRRFSIYKTSDTLATTSNWTLVSQSNTATGASQLCKDSTWPINDPSARRLKIVARAGTDSDIDSVWLTSTSPITPVKFAGISATNVNGFTKLSWKIATEVNTHSYIIEKSTTGASFKNSGEVFATNSSNYSWIDNAAASGVAFYRVKAVDKDGKLTYSSVVKISGKAGRPEFVIAPNVVRGRTLNLQISNVEKGNVELQVSNNAGQVVYRTSFMNEGGSVSKSIQLPYSLTTGTYRVQLLTSGTALTQTAILQ